MRIRLLRAVLLILALLIASFAQAQDENLLTNPGFEGDFRTLTDGPEPREVAVSWQPWSAPSAGKPDFFSEPRYFPASDANARGVVPRVRSGNNAQIYYSFYETHEGGIYQQISGLTPGAEVRFSIYAYVWSTRLEDPSVSEFPGGVAVRVGIDPSGGTNPLASSVEYTEAAVFYDAYRQYSIIAEAESDTITVFVRSTVSEPVQFTYVYLDDALLEVTPAEVTPTEEATATSTNTSAPTATPTNTAAPTNTTTPRPTNTPTNTPAASATPEEPTPTREGALPTATPIGRATVTTTAQPTLPPIGGGGTQPVSDTFPGRIVHTVQGGDTVADLAVRYGSSIEAIVQANGLDSRALIYRGQALIIPVRVAVATDTPTQTPVVVIITATPDFGTGGPVTGQDVYVVRPGDTLSTIARRFNTTVGTLVQLNGIVNANRIFVGQRIVLPGAVAPAPTPVIQPTLLPASPDNVGIVTPTRVPQQQPATYVIQPGDTLYRVALRFNVPLSRLAEINNISNINRIFAGQVLLIP